MDAFHERLILGAATIDELLADGFEAADAPHDDTLLSRRLAAWRRSCAAGDESLFRRRLDRDGWSNAMIEKRLAAVRRSAGVPLPSWFGDAVWIETALQNPAADTQPAIGHEGHAPCPFETLFEALIEEAEARLWADLETDVLANLTAAGWASLRHSLRKTLTGLCAAPLYERFAKARTAGYDRFAGDMRAGGFRQLFSEKPVLLRLIAILTRQWLDSAREFVVRLAADLPAIRGEILRSLAVSRVVEIAGEVSDPHNGGRSVLIVSFEDGARVAYKPKDLRLDVAWHDLVSRLNGADPPTQLRAARAIARDGYGWTEYIDHLGCADEEGCERFFHRAGGWLALLHLFAATDMHQENMIAAGAHPVPIDLETILQPSAEEHKANDPEGEAFDAAMDIVGNSVMTVGLLPAYGRSVDNNVFAMGGLTADWNSRTVVAWNAINSDAMRPIKTREESAVTPNLPHVEGRYAKFADYGESFITGFAAYSEFLLRWSKAEAPAALFDGFAGLPVRKIIRPTRFYYMLLQRLKDHRTMDDGAVWSAQADFVARLSEWDEAADPLWPLHRAERLALLGLNVPHFITPSDGSTIADATETTIDTLATAGLARAMTRLRNFDATEIAWQIEVIRENIKSPSRAAAPAEPKSVAPTKAEPAEPRPASQLFLAEANRIAAELSHYAVRRGPGAAWIGLDWLGDAEVFQLVCLGPDLYNGATGIALFLAAHAAATGFAPSGELALAGLSHLRKNLKSRTAARMSRTLGIGGATGLGSIVYALTVTANCLRDDRLLEDAHRAAQLFTDDLIKADKQLDVMGGSAGAILGLLRLYRDGGSGEVLARAVKCGEHLLDQPRLGTLGRRSWVGQGSGIKGSGAQASGTKGLNGMSHGAAGFAYALAALAAASGREEFATAAEECLGFENASYDGARHNWPDFRGGEPLWPCQWCHGAPGIGLARAAMARRGTVNRAALAIDIENAVAGVEHGVGMPVDTLCCGSLGGIEFFCEAGKALERRDLRERAAEHLQAVMERATAAGDYRWNNGKRQFNLGLFRGLAGVGYTLLRQAVPNDEGKLPNVAIWE